MIKSFIKLLVVLLIANAIWRLGSAYASYYKFKDAVQDLATHSVGRNTDQVKNRVMELAATYSEPIDADAVSVRSDEHHIYVEGAYRKPVLLLPGYEFEWPFALNVDGFVIVPVKASDLTNPQ